MIALDALATSAPDGIADVLLKWRTDSQARQPQEVTGLEGIFANIRMGEESLDGEFAFSLLLHLWQTHIKAIFTLLLSHSFPLDQF